MTARCGISPDCARPAVEAVTVVSPVFLQVEGRRPACQFHLEVFERLDWHVELATGAERLRLIEEIPTSIVGGVELEGWTETEKAIAWGRG